MKRILIALIVCAAAASSQVRVVREGQLVKAGTGGVTTKYLAAKDSSDPVRYVLPAAGGCGSGVAQTTAASGNTFYLLNKVGIDMTHVAEGSIAAGHVLTGGRTTPGRVADTGVTTLLDVPNTTCVVGIAQTSATDGQDIAVRYLGPGVFGAQITRGFGATFDGGGSALTAGASVVEYVTVPYACTVKSYDIILTGGGTATFLLWKVGPGTALPTSGDSISTSGFSISSGAAVHSANVSDLTTTAIGTNDIVGINLSAVATATKARLQVQCQ